MTTLNDVVLQAKKNNQTPISSPGKPWLDLGAPINTFQQTASVSWA